MVYLINCVVMFKGRRLEPCENSCPRGVCSLMAPLTALRVPSPVEDFYREEVTTPIGTCKAVTYRNDTYYSTLLLKLSFRRAAIREEASGASRSGALSPGSARGCPKPPSPLYNTFEPPIIPVAFTFNQTLLPCSVAAHLSAQAAVLAPWFSFPATSLLS